ncbi:MAG: hypothetical protein ACFFCS_12740 [Candidatus Hodarchaeota archaeon]
MARFKDHAQWTDCLLRRSARILDGSGNRQESLNPETRTASRWGVKCFPVGVLVKIVPVLSSWCLKFGGSHVGVKIRANSRENLTMHYWSSLA